MGVTSSSENLKNKPRRFTMEEKVIHPIVPPPSYEYDVLLKTSIQKSHPAHYTLKIDSFSLLVEMLQKTGKKCYDSNIFKASDYEWKLSVYPNGDKERDGKGYISLYLSIQRTNSLPQGWEVNANFKFFLYDQIRDEYLSFQDASGKSKRLHEVKKEWGIAQLMDLNVFKDATKGYLLQDKCVFGVEILASGNRGTIECLALPEKLCSSYTWKIPNFSKTGNCVQSGFFVIGNKNWNLTVYPKGDSRQKDKYLSFFLSLAKPETGIKVFVDYKLRIKNQKKNGKDKEFSTSANFSTKVPSLGWSNFLILDDIKDSSKGFLVKDTLIAQVEIISISTMKTADED